MIIRLVFSLLEKRGLGQSRGFGSMVRRVSYSNMVQGLTFAGGRTFSYFISAHPLATRENITIYLTQLFGSTHLHASRLRVLISGSPQTHLPLTFNPFIVSAYLSCPQNFVISSTMDSGIFSPTGVADVTGTDGE